MITSNVLHRVFRVQHNNKTGSAYTIEKGGQQYLVSASHVFEGEKELDAITIYHDNSWKTVPVDVIRNWTGDGDTIVFRLTFDLSPRLPVAYTTDKMILGSWAYFLGFPYMVTTGGSDINRRFPLPLIKAGLISGMHSEKEGIVITYLDGHANRGFSGGPAVWINPMNPKGPAQIFGTISAFRTEYPINPETKDDLRDYSTNAGIVEAIFIRDILQMLP
ncbi:hypothetical protein [Cyanobium sp. L1E-Cus]|jgi:hypothetical protein|uniref:hypothetical protein n=1 Tax=Cyanobium sp. L1E-Cus TaxID=2823714 RepID=UPI0020CC692C|nr:hypothetical protein [Cyanobium sp. L1E-Cus]MCP9821294.1 hypothetical protein [Cyanobium sp. L1E-Cus]